MLVVIRAEGKMIQILNFCNNRFELHTKDFSILMCSATKWAKLAQRVGLSTSWPFWPALLESWTMCIRPRA